MKRSGLSVHTNHRGIHERRDAVRWQKKVLEYQALGYMQIVSEPGFTLRKWERGENWDEEVVARLHLVSKPTATTAQVSERNPWRTSVAQTL